MNLFNLKTIFRDKTGKSKSKSRSERRTEVPENKLGDSLRKTNNKNNKNTKNERHQANAGNNKMHYNYSEDHNDVFINFKPQLPSNVMVNSKDINKLNYYSYSTEKIAMGNNSSIYF